MCFNSLKAHPFQAVGFKQIESTLRAPTARSPGVRRQSQAHVGADGRATCVYMTCNWYTMVLWLTIVDQPVVGCAALQPYCPVEEHVDTFQRGKAVQVEHIRLTLG